MSETQVVEFVPLLNHEEDYEILNVYPFTIRKKSNHYIIKESIDDKGYPRVKLNCKDYRKHRLICEQFISNPNNLPCIDHVNHDKTDYHLSNLRWCTIAENNRNKSSSKGVQYTFVDDIDPDSIVVTDYGKHEFEGYYYDQTVDKFFFDNGQQYRELHINETKKGAKFVSMISTEGKQVKIYYSKFKKLYGLR